MINEDGYYGNYGGSYIPEMLYPNIMALQEMYVETIESPEFKKEYSNLLHSFSGRPTPLYISKSLSEKYHAHIYLKREDLNHTGSHKINNTIGQVLIAKKLRTN